MDTTARALLKHEVYDDRFWQDGLAGMYNIVKYNGEDVRAVAFVEDVQMRHALVNEHNRVVRELADKAAMFDWLVHHPSMYDKELQDAIAYGGERMVEAVKAAIAKHGKQWLGPPSIKTHTHNRQGP